MLQLWDEYLVEAADLLENLVLGMIPYRLPQNGNTLELIDTLDEASIF